MSALSTVALFAALLVQQQQENERVGPTFGGSTAVAPLMRDGIGSVFALSSLTGGVGQGSILGGATGGGLDLYGAGTAGGMNGYGGMVGGAGPSGLSAMGGGSLAMPSAMGHGMNAMGGKGGVAGFRSPSRRGLVPKGGLAAHGKAGAAGKYSLLGAQPPTAALDPLLKGLITAGPLTHDEASLIVHAMVASESSAAKDPLAKASLRDASRKFTAPKANAEANALQAKMDTLVPGAPDATSRPIDSDTLRAWFGALDVSNDGAISFLEWRDRTGLGLDSFRAFDTSGEGLIQFEELERALVLNAVSEGRAVDPALVDALQPEATAAEKAADAKGAKAAKAEPAPKIPLEELLKQVRTLLARAAAQQSALATTSGLATATDAKGKAGAAGAKGKQPPSPFDMLGTAPKSAPKKPAPKKPASAPYAPSSGNY